MKRALIGAALLTCACSTGPKPTPPHPESPPPLVDVTSDPAPRAFEPELAFAKGGPSFHPAPPAGIDRAHLEHQLGDERYWGLLGVDPVLVGVTFKGALTSDRLVVLNFVHGGDQHRSKAASFWNEQGRLEGDVRDLTFTEDVAGARDAPLVAFAVTNYYDAEEATYPPGVALFNTRVNRFYAKRFCAEGEAGPAAGKQGIAVAVALTPDGTHLAAVCATVGPKQAREDTRVHIWDLRVADPKPTRAIPVTLGETDWALGVHGHAAPLLLSDDASKVGVITEKGLSVFTVTTGDRVFDLLKSLPVHLGADTVVVRRGDDFEGLHRVHLASKRIEVIADGVTAAAAAGDHLYWAEGMRVHGLHDATRLKPIDLIDEGVPEAANARQNSSVAGLLIRADGRLLARTDGPIIELSPKLQSTTWKPKLPTYAWSLAWDGAHLAITTERAPFRWKPGAALELQAPRPTPDEPEPAWSFSSCEHFPGKRQDPNCADLDDYIISACAHEATTWGLAAGNPFPVDGPRKSTDAKVFAVTVASKLTVETWMLPGGFHSCSVDATRRTISFARGQHGTEVYRHDGTTLWKNNALPAQAIVAHHPKGTLVSLGDGLVAWLDPNTGKVRRKWRAHRTDCTLRGAFHPSEAKLATSSCDEAVRIWKLDP